MHFSVKNILTRSRFRLRPSMAPPPMATVTLPPTPSRASPKATPWRSTWRRSSFPLATRSTRGGASTTSTSQGKTSWRDPMEILSGTNEVSFICSFFDTVENTNTYFNVIPGSAATTARATTATAARPALTCTSTRGQGATRTGSRCTW